MPSDRSILERQMADLELRPFTLDDFHHRRRRKQRNRRIGSALGGLVVAVAAITGVLATRDADPEDPTVTADHGPIENSFIGTWEGPDTDGSQLTMRIERSDPADGYEILIDYDAVPACSGAPATMTGTGQVETGTGWRPGLVELVIAAEVTCDDGSTPRFERGQEEALGAARFVQDPVTGELIGPSAAPELYDGVDEHSFEIAWHRPGSEPDPGDQSATIDRFVDAVNAGEIEAFITAFAPDGTFVPRGFADLGSGGTHVRAREAAAWLAVQDAWGFEAEVLACRSVAPENLGVYRFSASSDTWIECDAAARWVKLSLEITDRWRFELRGARLVAWSAEPSDLDPVDKELPLAYPGLEAWEAWLATTHPDEAARLLATRGSSPMPAIGCDDPEAMCGFAERSWVIDGYPFTPTNLIPYDPALADEIEESINEYLDEEGR